MAQPVYLYGFVPRDAELPQSGLLGVGERPVELYDVEGGFRILIAQLPAEEFAAAELERQASNLEWVARQGVAHERVVAWFVDHAQILPVRLLTLYSGLEPLLSDVRGRAERVARELERLRGLREWDLKVSYREDRLTERLGSVSPDIQALDQEIEAAPPGRRFLLQKKRRDAARAAVSREARRLASELLNELGSRAADTRIVQPPRAVAEAPVVLSAALLVSQQAEPELRERVRARAAELETVGVDVTYSGPWAPYRFVEAVDEQTA